jgi:hypothetical protein
MCPQFVTQASAACFTTPTKSSLTVPRALFSERAAAPALDAEAGGGTIVGLWNSEFLLGDGPDRYDQTFQTIHADGTEMMVSNGLPPALGNICVGIWKQVALRTFRIKHVTWNWDTQGHFAGTFVMLVTLRLDRRGNSYTGTWTADSYDPDGTLLPQLHAEGAARGTRITLN